MGGGLMQLVSYGAQDIYLTSNPNTTSVRSVENTEGIKKNTTTITTKSKLKSELNKDNNDNCPICMECMINKEIVICKGCNKCFDKTCIESWLVNHNTCPLCRCNMFKQHITTAATTTAATSVTNTCTTNRTVGVYMTGNPVVEFF